MLIPYDCRLLLVQPLMGIKNRAGLARCDKSLNLFGNTHLEERGASLDAQFLCRISNLHII
jgi:hypothetical protein